MRFTKEDVQKPIPSEQFTAVWNDDVDIRPLTDERIAIIRKYDEQLKEMKGK